MRLTPFLWFDRSQGKERRLPFKGVAALMGVLASSFEGSLRNYFRWELFRADPRQGIDISLCANLFDARFFLHATLLFAG
jgi:hypothetical protein